MKTSITSAQAMTHPTVVETINALSELCRELREELETARADERDACAKVCDDLLAPDTYSDTDKSMWDVTCTDCAAAIRARGTT